MSLKNVQERHAYEKLVRERLKREGKCAKCWKPRGESKSIIHCEPCRAARRTEARLRIQEWRGQQKCCACGKPRRADRTLCDICAAKIAARAAKHGVRLEGRQKLFDAQNGKCAICERELAGPMERKVHVDHDHATGKVRGLLCHHCNVALGNFQDSTHVLRRALAYLEKR